MTYEFRSIRGVRVDQDKVIISMKGGKKYANSNARAVCAAIMEIWGGPKAALFTPAKPIAPQLGMTNAELMVAWRQKLTTAQPQGQELSAFAVGIEWGWERARSLDRCDWDRVHHVLAKHNVHPGRTDGHLADVIDAALAAVSQSVVAVPAPATADFLHRTNQEYAAWCSTFYAPEALDGNGRRSLHGLWAWQEQERRKAAAAPKAAPAESVAKMSGFEAMADGDLILCVNLLDADACDYEQMSDEPEHQAILRERAAARRALAARMKAEVDRRGAKRWDQTT